MAANLTGPINWEIGIEYEKITAQKLISMVEHTLQHEKEVDFILEKGNAFIVLLFLGNSGNPNLSKIAHDHQTAPYYVRKLSYWPTKDYQERIFLFDSCWLRAF